LRRVGRKPRTFGLDVLGYQRLGSAFGAPEIASVVVIERLFGQLVIDQILDGKFRIGNFPMDCDAIGRRLGLSSRGGTCYQRHGKRGIKQAVQGDYSLSYSYPWGGSAHTAIVTSAKMNHA